MKTKEKCVKYEFTLLKIIAYSVGPKYVKQGVPRNFEQWHECGDRQHERTEEDKGAVYISGEEAAYPRPLLSFHNL